MENHREIIDAANRIAAYLARRDVDGLSAASMHTRTGADRVDLLILLGSAIPATAVLAARAYRAGLVRRILISGGRGHSTAYLVENMAHPRYRPWLKGASDKPEAAILAPILYRHGVPGEDVLLESESLHCGDNAAKSLEVVNQTGVGADTVLLVQDPAMQRRSHAAFEKVWEGRGARFISYAPFIPQAAYDGDGDGWKLCIPEDMVPAWAWGRFLELILGEIPRLRDDREGYGPRGKGFIVHVDMPEQIDMDAALLARHFPHASRSRNWHPGVNPGRLLNGM